IPVVYSNKSFMYFDFGDLRPDTPRVPPAISAREGVLLSLVAHLVFVIGFLLAPKWLPAGEVQPIPIQPEPLHYVEMLPMHDLTALPKRPAEQSDVDRRSTTRERAPTPENAMPMATGSTPEKVEGAPEQRAAGPTNPQPAPPEVAAPKPPEDLGLKSETETVTVARPASGNLGAALRNLQQYLQQENFNNPRGGDTDASADIQFDSMGVDFGPWIRRFAAQVRSNWLVPSEADFMPNNRLVVVQFYVHRNGTITDIQIVQPATPPAFTTAAVSALKLSNPTMVLPPEYPTDKVLFTVSFHYYVRNGGP
ncbi:MAG: TonB C-terminal domain-containing protein, partial [Acidobacteriota bacterium]